MPQIDPNERNPDFYDWIGYILAVAVLVPLGWWAKDNIAPHLAAWLRSHGF